MVVVVSPSNVAGFPDGGGHFWVYMQYIEGLRQLGCEVYWLERCPVGAGANGQQDTQALRTFYARAERFGFRGNVILYSEGQNGVELTGSGVDRHHAEAVFQRADLLLNFYYAIPPGLLACFRRTALVDIDPGLLQFWISTGQLRVPPHDYYFTIGETVGTPQALFPDCGLPWVHIRPPVCLDLWPYIADPSTRAFTTVSSWWGDEWITDGKTVYENNKRVTFLEFARLPRLIDCPLELAIYYGEGDADDLRTLRENGWEIRHSAEVADTPDKYQAYVQTSRGEFSCAKPSCMKFQNAWISDRTLCYLASGRPAVVQDTGRSSFLPSGEGLFRFSTLDEAADALSRVDADYEKHRRAAREIVEACFDARPTLERILRTTLR
ncbi:MAG: glycosyltransferase family 1 protein [Acidobacteria bacterium]|nr:MAG: glycosyltransferase family 1 protein [Acidobacteriota bacterium]